MLSLFVSDFAYSQRAFRGNYWKQQRKELIFGIGPTNFLGDLAGKDQIGSDFYQDLEINSTRYVVNLGFRYFLLRDVSVRASLSYGVLSGNDALTNEPFRKNRNLHFKAPITEFSILGEYHVLKENWGKRHKIKGARNNNGRFGLMGFAGIGIAKFTPKSQYFDGQWYDLQPLSTGGQGLAGGPDEYKTITMVLPLGFGVKYMINRRMKIGLNFGYRKTFSDYIDDVSGSYFDRATIEAANGPVAGYFADPSLTPINQVSGTWQTRPGEIRGDDSDKDSYLFGVVNLTYSMQKKRGYRKIKKRRSVPSF